MAEVKCTCNRVFIPSATVSLCASLMTAATVVLKLAIWPLMVLVAAGVKAVTHAMPLLMTSSIGPWPQPKSPSVWNHQAYIDLTEIARMGSPLYHGNRVRYWCGMPHAQTHMPHLTYHMPPERLELWQKGLNIWWFPSTPISTLAIILFQWQWRPQECLGPRLFLSSRTSVRVSDRSAKVTGIPPPANLCH